jgi:XRE family transcriptional regulator, thiamine biosynthesis regulator
MANKGFVIKSEDTTILKIALAKLMDKKGYDQVRISKILKLSQPMVSQYLKNENIINPEIIDIAEKIINSRKEIEPLEFSTFISFEKKELKEAYLADINELITDEKQNVLDSLTKAFDLIKEVNMNKVLPEVKVNLAMSKNNAKSSNDIAAFSNGFMIINDRISMHSGIAFGKSKHLASLILYLKTINNSINSIMNIKYSSRFKGKYLSNDYKISDERFDIENDFILHHKGDFGIEPCTYIIGKDAEDVARRLLTLLR